MGRPLVGPQPQPRHDSQQLVSGHRCRIEHHGRGALDAPRGHPPGLGPAGRRRPLRGIAGADDRRAARSGQVSAAAQRRLDHLEALAAARGVIGRCGLPGAGALPIQVPDLDFACLACGHRPDAEPFRFCRLFLPGRVAHGLSLRHAPERGGVRALRIRRLYERREFDLAGGAARVQPSRAHRDALEHQHQAGADAIDRARPRPHRSTSSRNSGRPLRRPCGTSSWTSGSAASTSIRTGAWR